MDKEVIARQKLIKGFRKVLNDSKENKFFGDIPEDRRMRIVKAYIKLLKELKPCGGDYSLRCKKTCKGCYYKNGHICYDDMSVIKDVFEETHGTSNEAMYYASLASMY